MCRSRRTISTVAATPATSTPTSSPIPNATAAVKPITDQKSGMAKLSFGTRASVHDSKPKLKIVVGQGATPKTGERG